MKKLLIFFSFIGLIACKSSTDRPKDVTITSTGVRDIVSYLASDDLMGRQTGTAGIDSAATFIEQKFKSYGVKPYFESYRDNFKVDSLKAFNVVGYIEGSDKELKDEIILIGAHYDHVGKAKMVGTDSIANGANDNATGTAVVMTMAKYFGAKRSNKRSLVFVLFSAEEMGLLGSKHLADRLKSKNINLYSMVNFEMVGVPLNNKKYEAFVTGFDRSNLPERINTYTGTDLVGFSVISKKYRLFSRSDNYPFFKAFNVPCHTISSCDLTNFDYYHQVGDESQLMDYDFMASLINRLIPAIEGMTNSKTKEVQLKET